MNLLNTVLSIDIYNSTVFFKATIYMHAYLPAQVSPSGVISRDEKVFRFAKEKNLPLVMLTSGP